MRTKPQESATAGIPTPRGYEEPRARTEWSVGGSGPGAGAMGDPLWIQLLKAGATPSAVQEILAGSYGHATIGDAAGMQTALRGAFTPNTWSGRPERAQIAGTGTSRSGIQAKGMDTGATKDSEARRDLADYYERRRKRAGMEDELAMRQRFAQQMLGLLGNAGGGKVRSSGMREQLFNNAGRPQAVQLRENQERDITPDERAALLRALMGGL